MTPSKTKTCPATFETADGRTLECALELDHGGMVHEASDGHAWGDSDLALAALAQPPESEQ